MNRRIYLDHAATSPMPPAVLAAYTQALRELGNPASTHQHGQQASLRLESARQQIAEHLGTEAALVTLTGGGTESINLALKGLFWAAPERKVLLLAEGEHHASIEAAEWLRDTQGAELHMLPIDSEARLQPEVLRDAIARHGADRIAWCSFLLANNEVGTVQPAAELVAIARSAGVRVHIDAVAALGQVPIDFSALGAHALSVSAHKIGGPVGVGALLLSRDANITPLFHGGSQQRGRSGTQHVAGAIAFAAALAESYGGDFSARIARLGELRERFVAELRAQYPAAVLRGAESFDPAHRLPGNAHFTFPGCQGDSLVYLLDAEGVSVSMGSACQAGVAEVSHVLIAMGVPYEEAIGSLRFSFSPHTSEAEVQTAVNALLRVLDRAQAAGLA